MRRGIEKIGFAAGILLMLTAMFLTGAAAEPFDYIGEWENDTVYAKIKITKDSIAVQTERRFWNLSGYNETDDGLEFAGQIVISRTEDGGLKYDAIEGTFYRFDEAVWAAHVDRFEGIWTNPEARVSLLLKDLDAGRREGDYEITNFNGSGYSWGPVSINVTFKDGITGGTITLRRTSTAVTLDSDADTLTVEGVEGVFQRVPDVLSTRFDRVGEAEWDAVAELLRSGEKPKNPEKTP